MVPELSVWQDSRGCSEVGVAFQWGRGGISLQKSGQKEDRDIGILCNKEPSPQISGHVPSPDQPDPTLMSINISLGVASLPGS